MKKAKMTLHPDFRIGEISGRLFGAFLEPIGSMVNGTMYNPKHPTADEQGFRKDVIKALSDAGMPAMIWPAAFLVSTFSMIRSRMPFSSKMNVRRRVPMVLLPYIFFSPHAPKSCSIFVEVSASSLKGSPNFARKPPWDLALSLLTPTTLYPAAIRAA